MIILHFQKCNVRIKNGVFFCFLCTSCACSSCDCTCRRMSEMLSNKVDWVGKAVASHGKKINWITWPNVISDILIRAQPPPFSAWEINLVPRAIPGKALGTSCVRTLFLAPFASLDGKTVINVLLILMKLWTTLRTFSTSESALRPPVLPWRCQSRDSSDCKL